MNKLAFARRLTNMRKAAGLSMYELAKRTGLSAQAIAKLEKGSAPSWDTVRRLAYILGVSITAFETWPLWIPPGLCLVESPPELTDEEDADLSDACMKAARATMNEAAKRPGRKAKRSVQ